jgi:hypothetical protein
MCDTSGRSWRLAHVYQCRRTLCESPRVLARPLHSVLRFKYGIQNGPESGVGLSLHENVNQRSELLKRQGAMHCGSFFQCTGKKAFAASRMKVAWRTHSQKPGLFCKPRRKCGTTGERCKGSMDYSPPDERGECCHQDDLCVFDPESGPGNYYQRSNTTQVRSTASPSAKSKSMTSSTLGPTRRRQ